MKVYSQAFENTRIMTFWGEAG
jgi:hypothetical protein